MCVYLQQLLDAPLLTAARAHRLPQHQPGVRPAHPQAAPIGLAALRGGVASAAVRT